MARRKRYSAEFKRQALRRATEAFPGHGKARDQEVAKLKRELKKITEERDFLREAARYFAKESK
jgi:transposase